MAEGGREGGQEVRRCTLGGICLHLTHDALVRRYTGRHSGRQASRKVDKEASRCTATNSKAGR